MRRLRPRRPGRLVVEQLAALGTRRVITVGTAASLQQDLGSGALVVGTRALRDEGLHHYLPPGRTAASSPALTQYLTEALAPYDLPVNYGPIWTVFAVGHCRTVAIATIAAIADSLVDRRPRHHSPDTEHALQTALVAAVQALHTSTASPPAAGEH
ncbi:hypothetical protein [Streptomyces sp. NPDC026589]|uniref:phosphorylase family protein n=1 Tax=Streptomyces sp. NPDC026589 TaxID=3155609 RepID=UPI003404B105